MPPGPPVYQQPPQPLQRTTSATGGGVGVGVSTTSTATDVRVQGGRRPLAASAPVTPAPKPLAAAVSGREYPSSTSHPQPQYASSGVPTTYAPPLPRPQQQQSYTAAPLPPAQQQYSQTLLPESYEEKAEDALLPVPFHGESQDGGINGFSDLRLEGRGQELPVVHLPAAGAHLEASSQESTPGVGEAAVAKMHTVASTVALTLPAQPAPKATPSMPQVSHSANGDTAGTTTSTGTLAHMSMARTVELMGMVLDAPKSNEGLTAALAQPGGGGVKEVVLQMCKALFDDDSLDGECVSCGVVQLLWVLLCDVCPIPQYRFPLSINAFNCVCSFAPTLLS